MLVESVTLAAAFVVAIIILKVFNSLVHLTVNAVTGIVLLVLAKVLFGVQIALTIIPIIVCALGGVIGAFAIIVLNHLGIAFL